MVQASDRWTWGKGRQPRLRNKGRPLGQSTTSEGQSTTSSLPSQQAWLLQSQCVPMLATGQVCNSQALLCFAHRPSERHALCMGRPQSTKPINSCSDCRPSSKRAARPKASCGAYPCECCGPQCEHNGPAAHQVHEGAHERDDARRHEVRDGHQPVRQLQARVVLPLQGKEAQVRTGRTWESAEYSGATGITRIKDTFLP
jgi:hypothetical protein